METSRKLVCHECSAMSLECFTTAAEASHIVRASTRPFHWLRCLLRRLLLDSMPTGVQLQNHQGFSRFSDPSDNDTKRASVPSAVSACPSLSCIA